MWRQRDGFGAGDGLKWAGCLARLHDQYVNGQLQGGLYPVFEAGAVHDAGLASGFDQQVNVTTSALVVEPGAIKPDLRALPQHGGGGALDGVNLGGGQAHFVDFGRVWSAV